MEEMMIDTAFIRYVAIFMGYFLPFFVAYYVSKRIEQETGKGIPKPFFVAGFSFAILGRCIKEINRFAGLPSPTWQNLAALILLLFGSLFLYLYVLKFLEYLRETSWKETVLESLPYFLLPMVFLASTYANLPYYPLLPWISSLDAMEALLYVFVYLEIGRMFKELGSKAGAFCVIAAGLFALSICVSKYPDLSLITGRMSLEEHNSYPWVIEHLLQAFAGFFALPPIVSFYLRKRRKEKEEVAGMLMTAMNEYLERLYTLFGSEVYDEFNSLVSQFEGKENLEVAEIEEKKLPALLQFLLLGFYRKFGRSTLDIAKNIGTLTHVARSAEHFISFGSDLSFQ
jgi:hypothetical protein